MTDVKLTKLPMLYHITQTGAVNEWECWTEDMKVCVRWGQQGGIKQIDSYIAFPKNVGKANATTANEQAVKEAKAKHAAQLRKKYFTSVEAAQSVDRYQPMLASKYEDHQKKLNFPVRVQPKYDGLRSLALFKDGRVVLQSRGNKEYDLPHLKAALEPLVKQGIVFDGEIYLHGVGLQTINSLARKPRKESEVLCYHIYDTVSDLPFNERWAVVEEHINGYDHLFKVPTDTAFSHEGVLELQKEYVERGFEGAMVRSIACPYKQGGRSRELLKVKSWLDAEYPVVGCKTGKDGLPVFVCSVSDGRTFDVRPKGTEEQRLDMLAKADEYIGKQMTVRYFDLTDDGLPHFGVGLGIRLDEDLPTDDEKEDD